MNKTFYDFIREQVAAIRFMLSSLRESTINTLGHNNAYELERLLFDAINALIDFEIMLEKIMKIKEKENEKNYTETNKRVD